MKICANINGFLYFQLDCTAMKNTEAMAANIKKIGLILLSITLMTFFVRSSIGFLQKKVEMSQVSQSLCVPRGIKRDFFSPKIIRADSKASQTSQTNTRLFNLRKADGRVLNFIHIPKAAGTSVEKAMGLDPQGHFKLYNQKESCYQFLNSHHLTPQHALRLNLDSKKAYLNNTTFAIVRNPYTRLVSDYQYMQEKGIINSDVSLDAFIEVYAAIVKAEKEERFIPSNYADHATSQSKFIYFDDDTPAVKEILHFESLAADWKKLAEKYPEFGIPKELPHKNQSRKGKAKMILTEAQKERIYQIYQEDFENFGYAK